MVAKFKKLQLGITMAGLVFAAACDGVGSPRTSGGRPANPKESGKGTSDQDGENDPDATPSTDPSSVASGSPSPTPSPVVSSAPPASGAGLKLMNPRVMVGASVSSVTDGTTSQTFKDIIVKEFNCGQALWYGAWGSWPANGSANFEKVSAEINWLRDNNISPHVHMLIGSDFYAPTWLKNGGFTGPQLEAILQGLIDGVMDHNDNKSKVDVWNVINEIIEDGTGHYCSDVVGNAMGWEADQSGLSGGDRINTQHPVFIRKAFEFARAKTTRKLEIRDYLIEIMDWPKHKGMYQLLKHMLNSGIPVDAVGIQGHFEIGHSNATAALGDRGVRAVTSKFKALGIEVHITEMDHETGGQAWSPTLAEAQSTQYYDYTKAAILGGASRVYSWGFQDGRDAGWLPTKHPLPWDENLQRKPAYFGWEKALLDTAN